MLKKILWKPKKMPYQLIIPSLGAIDVLAETPTEMEKHGYGIVKFMSDKHFTIVMKKNKVYAVITKK